MIIEELDKFIGKKVIYTVSPGCTDHAIGVLVKFSDNKYFILVDMLDGKFWEPVDKIYVLDTITDA